MGGMLDQRVIRGLDATLPEAIFLTLRLPYC
jgi:hypothetical protein